MSKNKVNTISKIIAYALLVLVLLAAVGFIIKFTNGGTTEFKTFYVQVGEQTFTENGEIELPRGSPVRFETKYTFASLEGGEHRGYNVRVEPNITSENDFSFLVDGQEYSFAAERDLTAAFNIERDDTGFTVTNDGLTVESIMQKFYPNQTVIFPDIDISTTPYFNLVISSYNDKQSVTLGLLLPTGVTEIILNEWSVVI